MHNLHWNVEGREFALIHEMTEKIYKMLQDQFDETAEVMKMQCEMPLGTMAEYLKNTRIKEISSCNYSVAEVLDFLDEDCRLLISRAEEVRETADKQDNYQIANLLEGSVTIHLPARGGSIHVHLDGATILALADRLISDPGVHIEIGG